MNRRALVCILSIAALSITPLAAHEYTRGDLTIKQPWTRPTPPGATVAAVYFVVHNKGRQADRLIGFSTPAAGRTELHETRIEGGMARMRPVPVLAVPARGRIKAEPGGLHLMLIELHKPLEAGQRIPLRLKFERAGEIDIAAVVENRAVPASEDHSHH